MVPIGGGSGAAGACVVVKAIRPSIEVIGVQSEAAPAAYRSWQARVLVADATSTFAEGLATRTAFELPQRILWELLDDFVLVSEDALRTATRLMIEKTRNLVEPAGAASLAAVLSAPERFAGRKVSIVCSGGNISPAQLAELGRAAAPDGGPLSAADRAARMRQGGVMRVLTDDDVRRVPAAEAVAAMREVRRPAGGPSRSAPE